MKIKFLLIGLVTLIEIGASISLYAQAKNNNKKEIMITKEITIDDVSGKQKMVITTTENGNTTVEEFYGEDVEHQLNAHSSAKKNKVIVIDDYQDNSITDIDIDKTLKEAFVYWEKEGNSEHEIIIKSIDIDEEGNQHKVFISEEEIDKMVDDILNQIDIEVTEEHEEIKGTKKIIIKEVIVRETK